MTTQAPTPADLAPGATFPDLLLDDHAGNRRSLSELVAGDPTIVHCYRGWWCPKEQTFFRRLLELQEEAEVAYCRIVSISVDPQPVVAAYRAGLGARWTFLCDPDRQALEQLGLRETTDTVNHPYVPAVFTTFPDLTIHAAYDGYWYWGRPTAEELRADLRRSAAPCGPDWDGTDAMSWCWWALVDDEPGDATAAAAPIDRDGARRAGWPRGSSRSSPCARPARRRSPARPARAAGWISLVLAPERNRLLFDDGAVQQARRDVLARPPMRGLTTLLRDASHFEGSLTVAADGDERRLRDDPFARIFAARSCTSRRACSGRRPPRPGRRSSATAATSRGRGTASRHEDHLPAARAAAARRPRRDRRAARRAVDRRRPRRHRLLELRRPRDGMVRVASVAFGRLTKPRPAFRPFVRGAFALTALAAVFAFYWTSIRETTVNETIVTGVPGQPGRRGAARGPTGAARGPTADRPRPRAPRRQNVQVATGAVEAVSHSGSGRAAVVRLADGALRPDPARLRHRPGADGRRAAGGRRRRRERRPRPARRPEGHARQPAVHDPEGHGSGPLPHGRVLVRAVLAVACAGGAAPVLTALRRRAPGGRPRRACQRWGGPSCGTSASWPASCVAHEPPRRTRKPLSKKGCE
jgi:peroxiredoxin